ncbi:3'-5' exonuclease-like [Typha angustifolia]|uniref:3'-5' exonuclease-like n=1 Tax=Typha angustifolia TaxID=59011 RepID=UPI003C2E7877
MTTAIHRHDDSTYTVTFDSDDFILTTATSSGAAVSSWISTILFIHRRRLSHLIVGLDVEWRPNYTRNSYPNPVAVLQLCVGRRCLVFQILYADFVPDSLAEFLADGRFRFVGVGVEDDAERLVEEHDLEVENTVDLRDLAAVRVGKVELRKAGLQNLVREVMGVHIEKERRVRMSAWDQHVLSMDQIKYACVDAFASFEVGRRLFAWEF